MKINVFSMNVWALSIASKFQQQRMKALPSFLLENATEPDAAVNVLCLQELFGTGDFEFLSQALVQKFPYGRRFPSGVTGSGLAIFSSAPIKSVSFKPFDFTGYHDEFTEGDFYAQKGVSFAKIQLAPEASTSGASKLTSAPNYSDTTLTLGVFVTHLQAEYNEKKPKYKRQRIIQTLDLVNFIRDKSRLHDCDVSILAGDLNMESSDFCYSLLTDQNFLTDCGDTGPTFNAPGSSFRGIGGGGGYKSEKLDYIMYRANKPGVSVALESTGIDADEPIVPINGKLFHLSDHYAVKASLSVTNRINEVASISAPVPSTAVATIAAVSSKVKKLAIKELESHKQDLAEKQASGMKKKLPLFAAALAGLLATVIGGLWFGAGSIAALTISTVSAILLPLFTLAFWNQLWKGIVSTPSEIKINDRYLEDLKLEQQNLNRDRDLDQKGIEEFSVSLPPKALP